jgi:lantibiotic modifying enzyme
VRWYDRAMFLDEHLDADQSEAIGNGVHVDRTALIDRWRTTCARGNHARFVRRLSALGLDPTSAVDALRPRRFIDEPIWARAAEVIASTAPRFALEREHSDDQVVPFASLYRPWTQFGLTRLEQRAPVPAGLRTSLAAMLRSRLRSCGEPILLEEFQSSPLGYQQWMQQQLGTELVQLFETLPVWVRLVTTATLDWIDALTDFLIHLRQDNDDVARLIDSDVVDPIWVHQDGDPHNHGRQVIVLTTAGERMVVYKPRSLAPEALSRAVSDHLRAHGVSDVDLVADVVDRGDHGWMAWIETQRPAPEQMARYSYNAGVTLALAHRLGIADLHFENVLPVGNRPVLVDLECLGNSRPNLAVRSADEVDREEILDRSVLTAGLLVSVANYERDGRDDSGLTGILEAADIDAEAAYEWVGLGTDDIALVRSRVRSRCDDEPVMLDIGQVIAGLDAGEAAIDAHGLGVDFDAAFEVRVIAQNSARYASLLQRIHQRAALRDGLACSIELDAVSRPGAHERAAPWRLAACEVERRALQRLDIPLFTVPLNGTSGRVGSHRIDELVEQSGTQTITRRQHDSGPAFRRLQRDITKLVLDQRLALAGRPVPPTPTATTTCPPDPRQVCEAIAVDLEQRTIEDDHGGLAWLDVRQPGRFARPIVTDSGLMAGNAGVGLFFAALARATQSDRWADIARRALAGDPPSDGPALNYGASGRAYALVSAGLLLEDDLMVRCGTKLLDLVPPPAGLATLDPLDLLSGLPGVAAAFAAVATMCGDPVLAMRATEYLDVSRDAWRAGLLAPDPRKRITATRIGVAHGITGLEVAVARVIEARDATGLARDERHDAWLTEMLVSENERIEQRGGVPARLDAVTREPDLGWCWGVSGFVTARRAIATLTGFAEAQHGIARGEQIAATSVATTDRACCGASSQLLALDSAACEPVVSHLLDRRGRWVFETGTPFQAVSLLRGVAGLGMALLHQVQPGAIPNPFILEPARA